MYFAVLKEHEQELLAWLPAYKGKVKQRVVIGPCVVLTLTGYDQMYAAFREWAVTKGWPYNITKHHDEVGYWFNASYVTRYDHQGEHKWYNGGNPQNQETREVLHQMIRLEHNDPCEKDRIFHAYLLNTDWENQLENGRLYVMRQLLGAD